MALIDWTNELEVGISSIDRQHKELVNIINELSDAMLAKRDHDVLCAIFGRLLQYTRTHFAFEEELFERHRYIARATHAKQHADLVQQLSDLKARFDRNDLVVEIDLMTFLKDWLRHHIQKSDRQYVPHLQAAGVA